MSRISKFDVAVVGGGAAGVGAALGAARAGASTVLVERYGFLGGAATNAQVLTYCGFFAQGDNPRPVVGGVANDVLRGLGDLGVDVTPFRSKSGYWIIGLDNEALKFALDRLIDAGGVAINFHARVTGAQRDGNSLRALTAFDHRGAFEIEAKAFVDASGEGTLAHAAGVPAYFDASRGDKGQYASYPFRIGGVAPGVTLDRAALTAISAEINAKAKDFRVRDDGGPFVRLPLSNELWWMVIDVDADGLSSPELSAAEMRGRRIAWACIETLRKRPGFENAYIVATGPQLGTRESRRPRTRRLLTRADGEQGRRDETGIARAGWPMEVHVPGKGQQFLAIGGDGFFDVPFDAIRAEGVDNLFLGGRVIGADAEAYGSVRVMGTAFATGQAAGVAAAAAALGGDAEAASVQSILRQQAAII